MYKNEPIFLKPVFQERIWGGIKLKTEFSYDIPSEKTGEAWVISALPHGSSIIKNGALKGKTLEHAWKEHGKLFNKKPGDEREYPLLVKIWMQRMIYLSKYIQMTHMHEKSKVFHMEKQNVGMY